jgi:hypothetical protein
MSCPLRNIAPCPPLGISDSEPEPVELLAEDFAIRVVREGLGALELEDNEEESDGCRLGEPHCMITLSDSI